MRVAIAYILASCAFCGQASARSLLAADEDRFFTDSSVQAIAEGASAPEPADSSGHLSERARRREAMEPRPGHWTMGLGPGFGVGMATDNIMYSLAGGYVVDLNPRFAGKIVGEADIGSGRDDARLIDIALGGDFHLLEAEIGGARPYLTADLGVGSARTQASDSHVGLTAGGGLGMTFASAGQSSFDILVHYKVMASAIAGANPSVLGVRGSVSF